MWIFIFHIAAAINTATTRKILTGKRPASAAPHQIATPIRKSDKWLASLRALVRDVSAIESPGIWQRPCLRHFSDQQGR